MLTDTVADVATTVLTNVERWVLEISGIAPASQVRARQVGGAAQHLRQLCRDACDRDL